MSLCRLDVCCLVAINSDIHPSLSSSVCVCVCERGRVGVCICVCVCVCVWLWGRLPICTFLCVCVCVCVRGHLVAYTPIPTPGDYDCETGCHDNHPQALRMIKELH